MEAIKRRANVTNHLLIGLAITGTLLLTLAGSILVAELWLCLSF